APPSMAYRSSRDPPRRQPAKEAQPPFGSRLLALGRAQIPEPPESPEPRAQRSREPDSLLLGPHHSLIGFCDRREAFVSEFLNPLAAIRFGGVDVPLRIGGDAVHAVEFSRLPPALAERRQQIERLPIEDVHAIVLAVGEIEVGLLRILREGDVPR